MADFWPQILCVFSFFLLFTITTSNKTDDINQLLSFKSNIADPLGSLSSWNANSGGGPCDTPHWNGITCINGAVFGLQLENMSLSGQLKLDPLTTLPLLRTLSFANNSFTGTLPDLSQFKGLKSVYFSMNKLSGNISDSAFDNMFSLKKVVLSMNQFSGLIPSSLIRVNTLLELWMDNNGFVGEIPDFRQANLTIVNVANNNLEGKVPDGLSKMNASFFAGNKGLCGPPTTTTCPLVSTIPAPSTSPSLPASSSSRKLSPGILVAIIVISIAVLLAILGTSYAVIRYRKQQNAKETSRTPTSQRPNAAQSVNRQRVEQGGTTTTVTQKKAMRGTVKEEREQGMLVFVNNRREGFELDDLLKASAEVLGSGELGSSYKALLLDGPSVVVKRFKEMNRLGKEEFEEHMRRIGRLSHPNLLPLVAYYYRKEEKLLVTDFIPNGSLASLLHANRTADNRLSLDWPTRLKIVKGIAQGLAYLHYELSSIIPVPHGHLKSSNVLLTPTFSPVLSDYALLPLLHHPNSLAAFCSPESHRLSPKSDVWSLGVLILEILTGKIPDNYTSSSSSSRRVRGGSGSDLANWVNSVVREEWTGEVFDGEMRMTRDGEGEMLSLLQIGLGCCEGDVNKRWELSDVVEKIEELKERDDNEEYSSFGGMTTEDEGFSFSTNNPSWVS